MIDPVTSEVAALRRMRQFHLPPAPARDGIPFYTWAPRASAAGGWSVGPLYQVVFCRDDLDRVQRAGDPGKTFYTGIIPVDRLRLDPDGRRGAGWSVGVYLIHGSGPIPVRPIPIDEIPQPMPYRFLRQLPADPR